MAQIDMSKLMANTQNLTKSEELKVDEQPKAQTESVELIDNETESHEDTNETEQAEETEGEKAVVRYVGNGIWKDGENCLWANKDMGGKIRSERTYSKDEYKNRMDLRFMITYGAMQVTFV